MFVSAVACNSLIGADEPELIAGAGGTSGSGGVSGSSGTAGFSGGGSGGAAGQGGNAGAAGNAGTGNSGGAAGQGGSAGSGAAGGAAGASGAAGTGGAAGSAGAAGTAGTGGVPECGTTEVDCDGLTPRECADGKWVPSGPACQFACAAGACFGECMVNDTECVGLVFRDCGTDNQWDSTTCPLVCDSTQGCVGSCMPGAYQCSGLKTLNLCNASGQYVLHETCTYECSAVGGPARCVGCTSGDGICPAGCVNPADTDCPKQPGQTCGTNSECGSGFCVDGVCCNSACTGACMECNLAGQLGTCSSISFAADADNCGSCGASCSGNHVARSCSGGQCVGACQGTYQDCDGNKRSNGCEVDIPSDVNHCGTCNAACSSNSINRACSGGQCTGTCLGGFADCNGDKRADGCEVNTTTDPAHCNTCNTGCQYGVCQASSCAFTKWGASLVAPGSTTMAGATMTGMKITVGGSGGVLAALGAQTLIQGGDPTVHLRLALYRDSSGVPSTLVAQTAELTRIHGATEGSVTPTAIAAGDYWLFFVADGALRLGTTATSRTWLYRSYVYAPLPANAGALTGVSSNLGHIYAVTVPN